MNKGIWALIGYFIFTMGLLSLILNLIGLNLWGMGWASQINGMLSFIIRLIMVIGGIIIIYLSNTNWEEENEG